MGDSVPTNSSVMEHSAQHCQFVNPVNLYLVLTGAGGLILNVFPLYVVFKFQKQKPSAGRDILVAALCIIDLLTLLVPLPIYLSVQDECVSGKTDVSWKNTPRPWICEMFFLMFIWLKLSAMFLITVMNYSSYLALNVKGQYRDGLSIGDRLSNSFFSNNRPKSRESRIKIQRRSSIVIANLVIGIALVAFVISSLPYLGLGPKGKHFASNSTRILNRRYGEVQLCQLEQISLPLKGKEYTFLFAVLMSSAACLILHLVHGILSCFSRCFWSKNLKQAQELDIQVVNRREDGLNGSIHLAQNAHGITNSYAKMTFFIGIVYFATWIPLMVAMGTLMSNYVFSGRFGEFALAGTFGNQFLGPIIYAIFVEEYRKGYADLVGKLLTLPHVFTEFALFAKKQRALTQASEQNSPMNHP